MESESNGPRIVAICVAAASVAVAFICTRMYTRLLILRLVGWEDYFMMAAGVSIPNLENLMIQLLNLRPDHVNCNISCTVYTSAGRLLPYLISHLLGYQEQNMDLAVTFRPSPSQTLNLVQR
jgi:hypothetical protein